ncbi:type I phosphomannose isomerase catalytic subunit [Aquimarina spongiae]|uniref:Phosphohexomutase n=1 Tax=Aquimarina spongiae TaxID=570521 RepID=A0A1M6FAV8_9FLAO|nr:type I phosphomannose isomerase catalytic subunit [Aquimarina spongiae]SHI94786.1 mannose-6-phosphate isomerase, type 1 [Aquimarina spongiae]
MLYPFKFYPILKDKIWGGDKLRTILNKPNIDGNIGESWEISTVGENISIVSNGIFEGEKLNHLIKKHKGSLLGNKVYESFGDQFPLLIKFIDAHDDLSIQLHPDDRLAKERHNSFGKTEMWYVIQADDDAKLIVDFNKATNQEEYQQYLKENRLVDLLNIEHITKGDSYIITAGIIHAIGKGTMIAEIQQTSDITYRVYDWDRVDDQGNRRELHTELALEALAYENKNSSKIKYKEGSNQPNEMISNQYFTTNFIQVDKSFSRVYNDIDSFVVFLCVEGQGKIVSENSDIPISMGETILIPSMIKNIQLESDHSDMKLLEVYIK